MVTNEEIWFESMALLISVEAVLKESGQTGHQIRYAEVVKTLLSPPTDYWTLIYIGIIPMYKSS